MLPRRLIAGMLAIAAAMGGGLAAFGQPLRPKTDERTRLVRIEVESAAQLAMLESLGARPWRCVIGPGTQEFSVSAASCAAIEARGVRCQVLQEDIGRLIATERERLFSPANGGGVNAPAAPDGVAGGANPWFNDYKTYAQVNDYIDALVALRPDLASKLAIGASIQSRTIYGMRITSPVGAGKPAVLYTGCQHAREWIAVMVPMYVADALVRGYDGDPAIHDLLDRVEFFIIPIVNPDGYEFTYAPGGDRLWRKNRRDNGDGTIGVDLNRNWAVDWGGPNSTSPDGSSEVYYGAGPFSEPETAALRDFISARPQLAAHVDFHSYAQLILQDWAYTNAPAPDIDLIASIGGGMNKRLYDVNHAFYENGWGGSLLYLASGAAPDWTYGDQGLISYTIELRDKDTFGFLLPPDQIIPTGMEAKAAAFELAERISRGIDIRYPRGAPAIVSASSPTAFTVDLQPLAGAQIQAASPTLRYRLGPGHPFVAAPLTPVSGTKYQATLPAASCGTRLQWYVEASIAGGMTVVSPPGAPTELFESGAVDAIQSWNFQTASGWSTATSAFTGQWQRGVPANSPNWPYDPFADADGSGMCFLTQNSTGGFSGVTNGAVQLTSPNFDLSAYGTGPAKPVLSWSSFLHRSAADADDSMIVEISGNGPAGPWTTVETYLLSGGTQWRTDAARPFGLVPLTSTMRLRFTAVEAGPPSIIEAAVDDVRISVDCGSPCPTDIAPTLGDGVTDIDDLFAVINCWGSAGIGACGDIAPAGGDGVTDIDDLFAVINAWGPCD